MSVSIVALLLGASATTSQTSTAPSQSPNLPPSNLCDTPEHRQFDFWVGRWDVYRARNGQLIAHSLIEKVYNGCAVRENWMPLHGFGGGSLNSYRPSEKRWRQFWTDAANNLHEYSGRAVGEALVFVGTGADHSGKRQALRMTYELQSDRSVLQAGEASADGGKTWKPEYQLIYRRSRR